MQDVLPALSLLECPIAFVSATMDDALIEKIQKFFCIDSLFINEEPKRNISYSLLK